MQAFLLCVFCVHIQNDAGLSRSHMGGLTRKSEMTRVCGYSSQEIGISPH